MQEASTAFAAWGTRIIGQDEEIMNVRSSSSRRITRTMVLVLAGLACLAMLVQDADARRLGGGRSFGRQSSTVTQQQSTAPSKNAAQQPAPQQSQPPQPAAPQPVPQAGNRWLGPLAGLAAGLGIAALLSHFGVMGPFAEALGSFVLIALLVVAGVVIWRMLRATRRAPYPYHPQTEPQYSMPDERPRAASLADSAARPGSVAAVMSDQGARAAAPTGAESWGIPADFDVPGFTRSAKVHFIRLQTAWDEQNLADIREFTTPEVYAEIKLQLDEEKGRTHHTEVVNLDAELLGIEESAGDYLASVRFSGAIREDEGTAAAFQEVWNLAKPKDGRTGWLLAGIQQIH
ncbi:MAG: hypothetical protein C5B46_03185 [Proteobacteria bacterium]|nr:MAG: hypothetical protein C5B46_03185 [Pseudomonadota bacterium]